MGKDYLPCPEHCVCVKLARSCVCYFGSGAVLWDHAELVASKNSRELLGRLTCFPSLPILVRLVLEPKIGLVMIPHDLVLIFSDLIQHVWAHPCSCQPLLNLDSVTERRSHII